MRISFETPAAVDDVLIETSTGEIYVQAKRTINLSDRADGALASVADQFVRQFRSGVNEEGVRRDFDPTRDRLVLAVGDTTVATIAVNLREALDRNRTGAATAMPGNLATALAKFTDLIDAAWRQHTESEVSPDERQALLAVCAVVVLGDSQVQFAQEALRDVAAVTGDEEALFDLLMLWAADASARGVGGDVSAIRLALSGKAGLKEPPSYRDDFAGLRAYSAGVLARLKRFTAIPSPEGQVTIARPVSSEVASAAREGSLAVTGEPGAGKSAVLFEAATQLAESATVIVLTVEANVIGLDALRVEIGLQHRLMDLLAQIPGVRPAYLFLDALDAVRGGIAEETYKQLVEKVSPLPGWHVIASIRTFDLRLGQQWRRLFAGSPPVTAHADDSFSAVRHMHIGLLSDAERQDLAEKSPSLATAIRAAGPRMETLARNPFNLALLGDLLQSGVAANTLSHVETRGELLEHYWQERIANFGLPATTGLKEIVERMLAAHSIDLPETEVPLTAAQSVDDLQRVGVLVTEPSRRIGFCHHVLFDYAIARLLLQPDRAKATTYLGRSGGAGLLVVPSLGYWLESLRKSLEPRVFWTFVTRLIGSGEFDPIVRVETARLCVESVREGDDLASLAAVLKQDDPIADSAFQHLTGSLIIRNQLGLSIETDAWVDLVRSMRAPGQRRLASIRAIIGLLLENNPGVEAKASLGAASRTLFDAMSADENLISWLTPQVVPYIARTYGTDIEASRERLNQLFEPERFARTGHIEVPWLAQEVLHIAEYDEEFVVRLFYRAFRGGDFSRDRQTSMSGSWILPLTSNAAQDFDMATHSLEQDYPELISRFPAIALSAFGAVLRAERERNHAPSEDIETESVILGGDAWEFEEDHSHIWAWDIDGGEHDAYAKLYRSTMKYVAEISDDDLLAQIPGLILREARIALAWRAVLEMASIHPDVLGKALWSAAVSPVLLQSVDTRRPAINLIAATYPFVSEAERVRAETEWLAQDFSEFPDSDRARIRVLGTLFEAIGESRLATNEARLFQQKAKADGQNFENFRPVEIRTTKGAERHWLEHEGIDVTEPDIARLLALSGALHAARDAFKEDATTENGKVLWEATCALNNAIAGAGALDAAVDREVCDALAEGLGLTLSRGLVPGDVRDSALEDLLRISHHDDPPTPDEEALRQFSEHPSWGCPSPRIEAAQAVAILATMPGFWPQVCTRYKELLHADPHPAVRLQMVWVIPWLERVDADAMWAIIEKMLVQESNGAILKWTVGRVFDLGRRNAARLEPLILPLERIPIIPVRSRQR